MTEIDPSQRDDPVESGALEDEPDVAGEERPPSTDAPAEGARPGDEDAR